MEGLKTLYEFVDKEEAETFQKEVLLEKIQNIGKQYREYLVEFKSLQDSIDTSSPGGRLVFHIMASIAEFERDLIRERTKAGMEAARARGRMGGRPKKISDKAFKALVKLYEAKTLTVEEIARTASISRVTFYRRLEALRQDK
jgi:DNA invertase Pin-like site-specific DNA recombinase